jgi:transposase-like protein
MTRWDRDRSTSEAARGLSGVRLVISDAHAGLVAAIGAALPGASWQWCRTHYLRSLLTKVPRSAQPWIATLVRTIFDQPDADAVHAQFDRVVATIEATIQSIDAGGAGVRPGRPPPGRRS